MRRGVTTVFFTWVSTPLFAATVESLGDAAIAHSARSGSWTIAAGGAPLSLRIDQSQDYKVLSIDGDVVLYAFDSYDGDRNTIVCPMALQPDVIYRMISVDKGSLGDMTGADLMDLGTRCDRRERRRTSCP